MLGAANMADYRAYTPADTECDSPRAMRAHARAD